jgi:hypothetical protein
MFRSIFNRHPVFNERLSNYCIQSTNESIRKMVEKYNIDKKDHKINLNMLITDTNNDPPDKNDFYIYLICFLSTTSFVYYFLNKKT